MSDQEWWRLPMRRDLLGENLRVTWINGWPTRFHPFPRWDAFRQRVKR